MPGRCGVPGGGALRSATSRYRLLFSHLRVSAGAHTATLRPRCRLNFARGTSGNLESHATRLHAVYPPTPDEITQHGFDRTVDWAGIVDALEPIDVMVTTLDDAGRSVGTAEGSDLNIDLTVGQTASIALDPAHDAALLGNDPQDTEVDIDTGHRRVRLPPTDPLDFVAVCMGVGNTRSARTHRLCGPGLASTIATIEVAD